MGSKNKTLVTAVTNFQKKSLKIDRTRNGWFIKGIPILNSDDSSNLLTTEEQAVLVAIDPINERLYARTPSNASPARADTPIPNVNANDDDQPEYDNEFDDKIDENGPETMVNVTKIQFIWMCVNRF